MGKSMEEPSVLDYVKSKLMFWRKEQMIQVETGTIVDEAKSPDTISAEAVNIGAITWPWRSLLALGFAIAAQLALEPPNRHSTQGILLYSLALALLGWSIYCREWRLPKYRPDLMKNDEPQTIRKTELILGILLGVVAFITFGGDHLFNSVNLLTWLGSIFLIGRAFWVPSTNTTQVISRLRKFIQDSSWQLTVSRWSLLILFVLAIGFFFRFYQLNSVPLEMVSDHAEKLLDVYDVGHGLPKIYFPRNTGREFFQMYLTAAVIQIFGTGYSFLSLKIGTVLAGFLTLPFIYLLGVEIANRRVGLLAMLFAGIAYWPNVISRIALRFTLYPFFTAPALYFLIRGLRRRSRNDFILSGVFLGFGLHGYSPMRIVPIFFIVAVVLFLIHRQSVGVRKQVVFNFMILVLITLIVFIPLMRYTLDNPDMVTYRSLTRLSSLERELPGSPLVLLFQNMWKSLLMFSWDNGSIWVHSITGRPALDVVSAALFHLGIVLVAVRYVRKRHWMDIFLLVSIPVLMLPSILSLAFPSENPSLNRSGAVIIPVFIIVGLAFDGLLRSIEKRLHIPWGRRTAWLLASVLFIWSAAQNYGLVFDQYRQIYLQSSWNTSEIGHVIKNFTETLGDSDHVWVIAYPYWVDTRLAGINAGLPTRDFAIWPDQIPSTAVDGQTKLFILKPDDIIGLSTLREVYPNGAVSQYVSAVDGKDFLIYLIPGNSEQKSGGF